MFRNSACLVGAVALVVGAVNVSAQSPGGDVAEWHGYIDAQAEQLHDRVVEWRRHFHANPELSNREFETAEYIAGFLRGLDMEVQTGVAHTGVVGCSKVASPVP